MVLIGASSLSPSEGKIRLICEIRGRKKEIQPRFFRLMFGITKDITLSTQTLQESQTSEGVFVVFVFFDVYGIKKYLCYQCYLCSKKNNLWPL